MYHDRLPSRAAATRGTVAALALLFTAWVPQRLGAQQSQSAPTPEPQTERHGYAYGVPSVVMPTVQTTPQAAQPAATNDDAATVHLDQLMTLREWDATGVARLRPNERAALEAWMQRYRGDLLDNAAHAPDAGSAPAASNGNVSSLPAAQPTPAPTPAAGYASAFAVPASPPVASQGPVASAPVYPGTAYAAPAAAPQYAPTYAPASGPPPAVSPPAAYPPAAVPQPMPQPTYQPAPPQGYQPAYQPTTYQPSYQSSAQPTYPTYQPGYQPTPQPAPAPVSAPVYAPQQYPAAAPPAYAPAPAAATAPPTVAYPTAPSAPTPYAQPVAPAASPYAVTVVPASPAAPAGAIVKTGLAVQSVQVGNRFVSLTDGSMWDVYPGDRAEVGVWRSQDPVYVRLATTTTSGGFDRELVNASRNVLARVKFAGQIEGGGR